MSSKQLPEGWRMVKFGEMAKNFSKRVEPSETDLDIYVGLEHLDPDSLRIKRHGVPSDVAGQKLLVKKGQIIFGKRRAYQRKLGVADWDCICSAHAMVLEANPEIVLPEFLPFFMQSEVFMNRAVAISEGSLSPTIKWKSLSEQLFHIPNKKTQSQLIDFFKASVKVQICAEDCLKAAIQVKYLLMHSILNGERRLPEYADDWFECSLGDIVERIGDGIHSTPKYVDSSSYYFINGNNLQNGSITITEATKCVEEDEYKKHLLILDDSTVLLSINGTIGNVAIYKGEKVILGKSTAYIKCGDRLDKNFLIHFLNSKATERYIKIESTGSTINNLSLKSLREMPMKIPKIDEQKSIASLISQVLLVENGLKLKLSVLLDNQRAYLSNKVKI